MTLLLQQKSFVSSNPSLFFIQLDRRPLSSSAPVWGDHVSPESLDGLRGESVRHAASRDQGGEL